MGSQADAADLQIERQIQPTSQGSMGSQVGSAEIQIDRGTTEDPVKELFEKAMTGEWNAVLKLYEEKPGIQNEKITKSDDTALHIAVSDNQTDVVEKLVAIVKRNPQIKLENMKDQQQDTPLHLAAAQGNFRMCRCMAENNVELIKARNKDGETPLFLAVLHGKTSAFLELHKELRRTGGSDADDITHCKRNDGNTILHVSINEEYYDLAYDIIQKYPVLVDKYNTKGESCLHLLATHPSSFKSGCNLGPLESLIYKCMIVYPLKLEITSTSEDQNSEHLSKVPGNYETSIHFLELFSNIIKIFVASMPCTTTNKAKGANRPDGSSRCAVWSSMRCGIDCNITDAENPECVNRGSEDGKENKTQSKMNGSTQEPPFPTNYLTFFNLLELVLEILLVIFGLGFLQVRRLREKKRKHEWAFKLMDELVQKTSKKEYNNTGGKPDSLTQSLILSLKTEKVPETSSVESHTQSQKSDSITENAPKTMSDNSPKESQTSDSNTKTEKQNGNKSVMELMEKILNIAATTTKPSKSEEMLKDGAKQAVFVKMESTKPNDYKVTMVMDKENKEGKQETPILVAARMGVKEMVQTILKVIPVAIQDMNHDGKNVVLLAVENRHPHVYKFLQDNYKYKDRVFHKLDNDGNSALHLAATCGNNRPWLIHGAALQLQWEIKWYKFVKESMPRHFFKRYNNKSRTPKEVFTETHEKLVKEGSKWLTETSQSCSVVAALIAAVAFATAATVPGGLKQDKGEPVFEGQPAFDVFSISSLVALCFSVTSLTIFLTILTSRYQEADFGNSLPWRLIIGLTTLFLSIASMLISFCAGHFFVLKDQLKFAAVPVYVVTCIPITIFAFAQFPLFLDLLKSTFTPIPQRTYEMTSL